MAELSKPISPGKGSPRDACYDLGVVRGCRGVTVLLAVVLALLSGSSCTQSEGEVGVYVAPAQGGGPDAAIMIPRFDSGGLKPDALAGDCEPGRFEGTFTCNFGLGQSCDQNPGMGGLPLMGTVSIALVANGGEFLTVSGASLEASSSGYMLSGPLIGLVDCRVKKFAGSVDGKYTGPTIPPLPPLTGALFGNVNATYDPTEPALTNGIWCLTATTLSTSLTDPCADIPPGQPGSCIAGSCKGTWTATRAPGP